MYATSMALRRDPDADELASAMAQQTDIKREIIDETLKSSDAGQILESGRTVCGMGGSIHGPLGRFPTSVKLNQCPRDVGGAWHTHVTVDELRHPSNSLPDIAAVVYGELDVINVTGTQSAEYLVAADDPGAMVDAFEDAVGQSFRSANDVAESIISGEIDSYAAKSNVHSALKPLFLRVNTGFDDLDSRVDSIVEPAILSTVAYSDIEADLYYKRSPRSAYEAHHLKVADTTAKVDSLLDAIPVNVTEVAAGAAIGTVVGTLVERSLFK